METWIHGAEDMRPWCELIAEIVGYAFDDLDWDAVVAGMANADRHKDRWFAYSFVGAEAIHVRMAYDIWENNVSVIWEAPWESLFRVIGQDPRGAYRAARQNGRARRPTDESAARTVDLARRAGDGNPLLDATRGRAGPGEIGGPA